MDAQLVFRLVLIVVATVALVAIIMHYNSCMTAKPVDRFYAGPSAPSAPFAGFGEATGAPETLAPLGAPDVGAPAPAGGPAGLALPGGGPSVASFAASADISPAGGPPGPAPITPKDLLPKLHPDAQAFAELYPCGQGDLNSVNFLDAGTMIGISTNPKRNANLQLRSDPPLPKRNVSPWNVSTFSADCNRRGFEISSE